MTEKVDVHDHLPEAIEIPRTDLALLGPPTATSILQLGTPATQTKQYCASSSTTPPADANDARASSSTTQQPPEAQRPSVLSLLADDRGPSPVRQPVEPEKWPSWEEAKGQYQEKQQGESVRNRAPTPYRNRNTTERYQRSDAYDPHFGPQEDPSDNFVIALDASPMGNQSNIATRSRSTIVLAKDRITPPPAKLNTVIELIAARGN